MESNLASNLVSQVFLFLKGIKTKTHSLAAKFCTDLDIWTINLKNNNNKKTTAKDKQKLSYSNLVSETQLI